MTKLIAGLVASATILCSFSSTAFAGEQDQPRNATARQAAYSGLSNVMRDRNGQSRISGDLPKMRTGLSALPFYKGLGGSAIVGTRATRVGFRFLGREKETLPVTLNGKVVGQETRVVTRFFNRGTEKSTVTTHQASAQYEYKFRQSALGGKKSWEAHQDSTERRSNDHKVRILASAHGGDNNTKGMHSSGESFAQVTHGTSKHGGDVTQARVSGSKGWSD